MNFTKQRVQVLLNSIGNSIIQISLVMFFYRNPGAIDTAEGLARWIGINRCEVELSLKELQKIEIIKTAGSGLSAVYYYSPDESLMEVMDQLIIYLTDASGCWKHAVNG
jgi:predicted transcriptional regulator